MSVETLRRAAALMRERARFAVPAIPGGETNDPLPWEASPHGVHGMAGDWICDSSGGERAEHIASWHPAVALDVANLLDTEADRSEWARPLVTFDGPTLRPVDEDILAIARAYLGEQS